MSKWHISGVPVSKVVKNVYKWARGRFQISKEMWPAGLCTTYVPQKPGRRGTKDHLCYFLPYLSRARFGLLTWLSRGWGGGFPPSAPTEIHHIKSHFACFLDLAKHIRIGINMINPIEVNSQCVITSRTEVKGLFTCLKLHMYLSAFLDCGFVQD